MTKAQTVVSPCSHYIAKITSDNSQLEIYETRTGHLHRSYNITDLIRDFIGATRRANIDVIITRPVEWEDKIQYGPNCSKLAVVVDNYSFVIIFDIRQDTSSSSSSPPIFITIPIADGIEKCQWIPPPLTTEEEEEEQVNNQESEAYINSRQIAIFSKDYLYVKIYSLDCTNVLFTILYPLSHDIIIRPNKDNRFWSIIGNTLEHNAAPILYHFYNEGAISVLIHTFRLPNKFITFPQISWSPSGNWLSIFNDTEVLFGYHLMVYDFFGKVMVNGEESSKDSIVPMIDMKCFEDGIVDFSKENNIQMSPSRFHSNWLASADGSEYLFICGIEQKRICIQVISFNLLRVIKREIMEIPENERGWEQDKNGGIMNKNISIPGNLKLEITNVLVEGSNIFITLNDSYVLYYIFDYQAEHKIKFKTIISLFDSIIDIIPTKNNEAVFVTRSSTILYDMNKLIAKALFQSDNGIQSISYGSEEAIILYNSAITRNWEIISTRMTKRSPSKKRTHLSLIADTSMNVDEVTDTFHELKRARSHRMH
ncbi:uncharacterized protein J8A68_004090 [[Candida] subhashii]|uniref:Uncharacterized protein n=1 Tax=[Candida] subhashii TaxID=561895 RepID=A0A8J5QG85_9ASCO|nr:uncharacterized protein J8A68_004090 [[Candida] subhashii]KAG7662442.1 hypothetical protein J8A68_004090 [[Candida] subhashii]